MPAAAKSFWPALAAFMALSFTYTAVVARNEGNAIDNAKRRWQQQKARRDAAMSAQGAHLLEQQHKM
ncbi:uncharacterized protein EI97DRAFT_434994 [Westerdykella ornata]|uniref:HIG1 domain-containing protein n=1 Tax=Westerdykella ornata TaxID=318751 RepID=A0A6A6JEP1_WESOR|nr:uncharacterized protein EI97DRAFT_434994 [Westerdykella ornata]KAF2274767.1 hypothetical protein EI97DRAFT_434994 [Westerdykella ornata]